MNAVLSFLEQNRKRLRIEESCDPGELSSILLTPRFRASSHIIFFIISKRQTDPVFVAKVPRLRGDHARLDREVENLNQLHSMRPEGFDSIPRVVAYEDYHGYRFLVETALAGRPMKPAGARRQYDHFIGLATDWLIDLQQTSRHCLNGTVDWFDHLVTEPLRDFRQSLEKFESLQTLAGRTLERVEICRQAAITLVAEHGDFSPPNIMLGKEGGLRVVDWELANPHGLPVTDLYFFLSFITFARGRSQKTNQYLEAFAAAFWGENAWAVPYVERYLQRMDIAPGLARPLFLLCWARYVAGLVARLQQNAPIDAKTVEWLMNNRYFKMWQYTVDHFDELALPAGSFDSRAYQSETGEHFS